MKNNDIADLFDKKKTLNREKSRINNIHIRSVKPINVSFNKLEKNEITNENKIMVHNYYKGNGNNIYKFYNYKNLNTIKLHTEREKEEPKIKKIYLKNILIPSYSDNDNFDLNNINKNISVPINMDFFVSDIINDGDVNILKKKKVNKIYHVYQEKYAQGGLPTGFGDFIRSCLFIIQFCKIYDFNYEILIHHPIAYFLNNYHQHFNEDSHETKILNENIPLFSENNWNHTIFDELGYIKDFSISKTQFNKYVNHLSKLSVVNNCIFSYNIFFPYETISQDECNILNSMLEPTEEMQNYIDYTINRLEFIKNNYIVIHIRCGDSYLINNEKNFTNLYIEILQDEINKIIYDNPRGKILIISDNNDIKYILRDVFFTNDFKYLFNEITHIGEGVFLKKEKIKNTLLDFYLMSHSSHIYSFTSYQHGSGFSYWCSKVYNIPYKCKYIPIN